VTAEAPAPSGPLVDVTQGTAASLPLEALIGGAALLAISGYVGVYLWSLAVVNRYASGFVIDRCPVCGRGTLTVEGRPARWLGIPRVRRTVRCGACRSVLRETGQRRWRYAVDPAENAEIYRRYNGKEIDEDELARLASQPVMKSIAQPPTFVDHDDA
jgi:hypothetical protein